MRHINAPLLTVLLVALPSVAAAQTADRGLCAASEAVVLSCSVGRKIVSLCAKGTSGSAATRLVYRFGEPSRIELAYPAEGAAAAGEFYRSSAPLYGGGITTVSFRRDGYEYGVYAKVGRRPGAGAGGGDPEFDDGVMISRRGEQLTTLVCDDGGAGFRQSIDGLPPRPESWTATPPR